MLNQLVTVLQATSALIAGRGGGRLQTVGCALCAHLHAACIFFLILAAEALGDAVTACLIVITDLDERSLMSEWNGRQ